MFKRLRQILPHWRKNDRPTDEPEKTLAVDSAFESQAVETEDDDFASVAESPAPPMTSNRSSIRCWRTIVTRCCCARRSLRI